LEREVYDVFYRAEDTHWWFRARRRIIECVVGDLAPRRDLAIADVGCGTGGMMAMLSRFGTVTGVDDAPEAREYCRRRGFEGVLTPDEWTARGGHYDLVTAFDVVEHVEDDVAFLRSLGERLGPDGRLLVTVPAYQFMWSVFDEMNHHHRRYRRGSLAAALRNAGLTVDRATYFNTWLLPPIVLVRLLEKTAKAEPQSEEERRTALARWFKVGPANGLLEAVFASERHWLRRGDLPAGTSILAVARPAA
jgi:SAM-dependent methyltransferase